MGLVEWYVRSTIYTYMYDHQEARPRGAELKEAYTTRQMEMHIRRTNLFFFSNFHLAAQRRWIHMAAVICECEFVFLSCSGNFEDR